MNHERTNELLSAAADDDLSSAEQAELEELLSQSPDAGRAQAELLALQSILADVPILDVPADLHEKIVSRVTLPSAGDKSPIADWLKQIQFGSVIRYGFSGAIGVMLAVAVYESQPNFALSTDITEIVGTMAPDSERAGRSVLDSFEVIAAGVWSIARLERRDDALVIDIRLEAKKQIDITIDFAGADLEFEALAQTFNNLDSIEFSKQVLKVTGRGDRRFAVLMRSRDDEPFAKEKKINLEYSSNGVLVQKGTLSSVR